MVAFTDGTTAGVVTKEIEPNTGVKIIQVRVPATFVWSVDTLAVDLAKYGCTKVAGVLGAIETTAGSIVQTCGASGAQLGTTAVSGTTLTFTSTGCENLTKGGTLTIFAY